MRILAINGSPRGENGNTDRILQPFLEGAQEAGAEARTVYLKGRKINHCTGCFTCWTKTPGVCIHRDDMPQLLEEVRRADLLVYATPLYVFTVSGLMKDFMDRLIPLLKPNLIKRGDQYNHPLRYKGEWPGKTVLISNCGFPERHHFSGLVETFRLFNSGSELTATILCAGGELLKEPALKDSLRYYFDASRQAGRECVEKGRITAETQAVLDQLLAHPDVYARMANEHWDSFIVNQPVSLAEVSSAKGLSEALPPPPSGQKKPQTFLEVITGQAAAFNTQAAGELQADIQFIVTGAESGEYVLRIAGGGCTAHRGTLPNPTITIHTPSEIWLNIARGELSGQTAYMKGLYRTEGDLGLLLRMGELFAKKDQASL